MVGSDWDSHPGPVDDKRVDLTEEHDLRYWTTEFACTAEQLIAALKSVGVVADEVGAYLAARSAARPPQPAHFSLQGASPRIC
jgi:Protein of unknown function (DUF3606)